MACFFVLDLSFISDFLFARVIMIVGFYDSSRRLSPIYHLLNKPEIADNYNGKHDMYLGQPYLQHRI